MTSGETVSNYRNWSARPLNLPVPGRDYSLTMPSWALKGTAMTQFRIIALAAFAAFTIALAMGPAGSSADPSCGPMVQIKDPGLRASFAKFEATQSASASAICASYRNAGL